MGGFLTAQPRPPPHPWEQTTDETAKNDNYKKSQVRPQSLAKRDCSIGSNALSAERSTLHATHLTNPEQASLPTTPDQSPRNCLLQSPDKRVSLLFRAPPGAFFENRGSINKPPAGIFIPNSNFTSALVHTYSCCRKQTLPSAVANHH